MQSRKSLLFFVAEDWYFCSHRLPIALAAKEQGYDVYVVANENGRGQEISDLGFQFIPLNVSRGSANPFRELRVLLALRKIYSSIRPDLVHHVALKPVIYGSLIAKFSSKAQVFNAMAGLGFLFTSNSLKARVFRPVVKLLFRYLLHGKRTRVILQNPDDAALLIGSGLADGDRITVIRGSGVSLTDFPLCEEPDGTPKVILASRMLWDKGVGEFVAAARILKTAGGDADFILVGDNDPENPASIPEEQLHAWQQEGVVQWWGRRSDMARVLGSAGIVCLPSYREGLPKVLLEAASCGKPIVTTDAPGCREIVVDKTNGFLVPVGESVPLAKAIGILLDDQSLRESMGKAGRQMVAENFSVEQVVNETLELYRESCL